MLWDSEVQGVREAVALKDDGLFVKNLENVQGDERDVIIFSTGFSVDANGVLPLNFGPLNRAGGERRLNVAVTRARRRVMVFCSFEPEDLRTEQTSSVGIQHLRGYLEQAKYGVPERVHGEMAIDRHAEQIATALRSAGCVVQTELGLSEFRIDLAVAAPGRGEVPTLAVLLDGPGWAARATTGDRDGAPVSVLQQIMGWPAVARVWLPAWLSDPDGVVRDLLARATASAEGVRTIGETATSIAWATYEADAQPVSDLDGDVGDDSESEPDPYPSTGSGLTPGEGDGPRVSILSNGPPDAGPEGEGSLSRSAGLPNVRVEWEGAPSLSETEPASAVWPARYRESDLGPFPASVLERLDDDPAARRQVQDVMAAIVGESGPISMERLGRRVVKAYGRTRLVGDRLAQLRAMVPHDVRRDREESFLWPAGRSPRDWTGFRASDDLKARPLTDIALIEIANAMAFVATQAMGIGEDELCRQTYKIFGGNRLTGVARERCAAAIRVGVSRERLELRGGVVTARPR
jgi:hypothetical protein